MRAGPRSLVFLLTLTAATVIAMGLAATKVPGQASSSGSTPQSTPKTPWGAPDLQGTWSNAAVVPFERAKEFGNRQLMTDAEYKKAVDQLLERNKRPGRDSRESNGQDIRGTEKDVARAYNEHWFGDKPTEVSRRTSMIIDPPDGRMPAFTPEAQERINKKREYLAGALAGHLRRQARTDLAAPKRAVARLQPRSHESRRRSRGPQQPRALPAGWASGDSPGRTVDADGRPVGNFGGVMRIVESPDSVDIYYDIGQGTGFNRPIPITEPAAPAEGNSPILGRFDRAGGKATRWWWTSRISARRPISADRARTCT